MSSETNLPSCPHRSRRHPRRRYVVPEDGSPWTGRVGLLCSVCAFIANMVPLRSLPAEEQK